MKYFALICVLLLLSSCSAKPSSLISSTSPLPPTIRGTIETSRSDCQYRFLGIIPVTGPARIAKALRWAKKSADVDVLTDVSIDHNGGYYILFSNNCVRVTGMGVPRAVIKQYQDNQAALNQQYLNQDSVAVAEDDLAVN